MLESQKSQRQSGHQQVDIDDLLDDPELERLHAERVYALQKEAERRMAMQQKGHGEYQEVEEGQFLQASAEVLLDIAALTHAWAVQESLAPSRLCLNPSAAPVRCWGTDPLQAEQNTSRCYGRQRCPDC